jgi:hypothetical protein
VVPSVNTSDVSNVLNLWIRLEIKPTAVTDAFAFGKVNEGFILFDSDSFDFNEEDEVWADKDLDESGVSWIPSRLT